MPFSQHFPAATTPLLGLFPLVLKFDHLAIETKCRESPTTAEKNLKSGWKLDTTAVKSCRNWKCHPRILNPRLMTMSPLYPYCKPCSKGTHKETLKNLALFSSVINGIMVESRLRISIPWECFNSSIESKILSHLHRNNSNRRLR